jgi:hypothetical protein
MCRGSAGNYRVAAERARLPASGANGAAARGEGYRLREERYCPQSGGGDSTGMNTLLANGLRAKRFGSLLARALARHLLTIGTSQRLSGLLALIDTPEETRRRVQRHQEGFFLLSRAKPRFLFIEVNDNPIVMCDTTCSKVPTNGLNGQAG